jgi:hypothetical protein
VKAAIERAQQRAQQTKEEAKQYFRQAKDEVLRRPPAAAGGSGSTGAGPRGGNSGNTSSSSSRGASGSQYRSSGGEEKTNIPRGPGNIRPPLSPRERNRRGMLFQKTLSSGALAKLAQPLDMKLVKKLERKGWTINIVKEGSDEFKMLSSYNAEASMFDGQPKYIIVKEGASKSAFLEEFLHHTQLNLGLLEKYGNYQALEVHVKGFMLRHAKILGLDNPDDIKFLQQLQMEEIQRLERLRRQQ